MRGYMNFISKGTSGSSEITRFPTIMVLSKKLIASGIFCLFAVEALVIPELAVRLSELGYNEDADLTTIQLIKKYRYSAETHRVTTEDGYILGIHRITGPNSNSSPKGKQPVLVVHGLLSCSVDWIITGPERAFGYLLADKGYDVWLGNTRGNTFSREHNEYSTRDKEYWQFSWHEVGCNDLPAMIDYVLEKTNRKRLIYAGHSQGTTNFFVMALEHPEYQDKVSAMFALAPVAYLSHVQSLFYRVIASFGNNIEKIMSVLGYYEFGPTSAFLKELMTLACDKDAWSHDICANIIFLVTGAGSDQLNTTMLPVILAHVPAGASVKQIVHFSQVMRAGKFQQYDHGFINNVRKYKQRRPPVYDLSKIKVPVSLHYSSNDVFASPKDVDRLYKELGNPIGKFRVPHEQFTHLDFTWANDGRQLLYNKIIGIMEKYRD